MHGSKIVFSKHLFLFFMFFPHDTLQVSQEQIQRVFGLNKALDHQCFPEESGPRLTPPHTIMTLGFSLAYLCGPIPCLQEGPRCMHSNTFMPMEKGLYLHPRPQMHAPRQIPVQWRCPLLIVAPMIPKCMHQSKMPIFGKARKSHELWFWCSRQMCHFCLFLLVA